MRSDRPAAPSAATDGVASVPRSNVQPRRGSPKRARRSVDRKSVHLCERRLIGLRQAVIEPGVETGDEFAVPSHQGSKDHGLTLRVQECPNRSGPPIPRLQVRDAQLDLGRIV